MSLQSSMAVMKAKLAGNEMQLKALAAQGDMEAAAALKEMLDAKQLQNDVKNQNAMQAPEQPSVLDQMVQQPQMPQSGLAAYAHGGLRRGFFEGGTSTADMLNNPSEGGVSDYNPIASWFRDKLYGGKTREQYYKEEPAAKPAGPAPAYPDQVQARMPATNKETVRKPSYTGIAKAAAPAETSPPSDGPFDPMKRLQRQAGAGAAMPDLPAPEDMTTPELVETLAKLEPLQKKRDALRDKSREQLEAMYNATVKANNPSIWRKIGEMGAAMAAHGGRNPWAALGAGGKAAMDSAKEREKNILAAQAAYQQADLLEQQAQVRDQMGDVQGAHDMRMKADALRKQMAAQRSTEKLQGAQAGYYDAQADFTRNSKPGIEQMKAQAAATRAGRGSGLGAGAKGKPLTEAQRVTAELRAYTALKQDINNMEKPDAELRAMAKAAVEQGRYAPGAAASPAAPGVKFLGFE